MRFVLEKTRENPVVWLRGLGYRFQGEDKERKELAFYRPLAGSGYPRFHLHLKIEGDNLVFNLHLDQKRPVYEGAPAHSAEYQGPIIEKEAKRIKRISSS